MQDELLGRQSAFQEAKALFLMIGNDNTVEELRKLIAVPPRFEWALRLYAKAHPEEAHFVDRLIKFREIVAREFESLVRDGVTQPPAMTRPVPDCLASAGQSS